MTPEQHIERAEQYRRDAKQAGAPFPPGYYEHAVDYHEATAKWSSKRT